MQMLDPNKAKKLIHHLQSLISVLESQNDLRISQRINQSYYMQKAEELKQAMQMIEEAVKRVDHITRVTDSIYFEVSKNWNRDIRWLNTYLLNKKNRSAIL